MIDLYKEIDFSKNNEDQDNKDVQYQIFLKQAAKEIAKEESDHLRKIKRPQYDEELENHLIVSGIPVVKVDTKAKFTGLFQSFLDKKKIGNANGLVSFDVAMQNDVGNQIVYMIYKQASEAKAAFKSLNNYKFTKENTLSCFTVKQIHEVMKFNPNYKQPKLFTTQETFQFNFESQRMNQFAIRQGNDTMIRWLDHIDKSSQPAFTQQYVKNEDKTILKVGFSSKGRYFAVCSEKGTYLYCGSDFQFKGFYPQESPIDFKFSSNERYMITFNGNNIKNKQNFIIWGVEEQIKLKSYKASANQTLDSFQFNHKSTLLAIASTNEIFFYNLDSVEAFQQQLKLTDQQSYNIKANHIQKIAWLRDNKSLVCVCYEIDYNPNSMAATRVFIYDAQNKVERKWRTWTEHAKKGEIIVSEKGEWVAVIMKKFLKRNHFSTVIQIGNLLKNDDPVQISSLEIKDVVGNVSWDFNGNRVAIIHEDEDTRRGINVKHIVQFYQILIKGRKLDLVKIQQIKNVLSNRVVLSSTGAFFAVYNISQSSPERGKISFGLFSKDKNNKKLAAEWIKQNIMIHQLNYFKIDVSGRFILVGTEKSYQIWNMVGQIIFKDTLLKPIHDLEWRPRALNYLSEEGQQKLLQQQKDIKKKYEQLDIKKLDYLKYQKQEAKKQRKAEFIGFLSKKRQWNSKFVEKRKKILGFDEFLSRTSVYEVVTDIQIA